MNINNYKIVKNFSDKVNHLESQRVLIRNINSKLKSPETFLVTLIKGNEIRGNKNQLKEIIKTID